MQKGGMEVICCWGVVVALQSTEFTASVATTSLQTGEWAVRFDYLDSAGLTVKGSSLSTLQYTAIKCGNMLPCLDAINFLGC